MRAFLYIRRTHFHPRNLLIYSYSTSTQPVNQQKIL